MRPYCKLPVKERNMELLQLKYFCDAAKTENFSRTAKKFGVPPSDISQSIKRLETELGCSLFTRRANSLSLNDRGSVFFGRISTALGMIEAAVSEVNDDGVSGAIKICININRRIVMKTVESFRSLYPKVDIVIKHGVYSGYDGFDLLISADDLTDKGMTCEKLFSEPILLAVKANSALARKESITAEDLKEMPFVSMGYGENLYTLTQNIGEKLGFKPHIAIQSDDPFYIRRCVELGLGVAFVPALSWQGQFSEEIILKSIGEHSRNTYLCRGTKKYMSGCSERFIELLYEECKNAEVTGLERKEKL